MGKKLSEMTLEELWALFPIFLTEHKREWAGWFDEEKTRLLPFLPADEIVSVSHIGSTAVSTIWAKPIIDILIEVRPGCRLDDIRPLLAENGYILMSVSENRMSFNRGYTENGFAERVYHLHLRYAGDNDELYFRDYLIAHPDAAKEYERLKLSLWKEFEHDRDGYTGAKSALVRKYTNLAKEEFPGRYAPADAVQ
ncbi:MAG: GrpB family protein [Clostridia bacterium]|nr:GrpB family protein [Clostridia bacterium]